MESRFAGVCQIDMSNRRQGKDRKHDEGRQTDKDADRQIDRQMYRLVDGEGSRYLERQDDCEGKREIEKRARRQRGFRMEMLINQTQQERSRKRQTSGEEDRQQLIDKKVAISGMVPFYTFTFRKFIVKSKCLYCKVCSLVRSFKRFVRIQCYSIYYKSAFGFI